MNTSISLHFRPSTRMGHHPGVLFIRLVRQRKSCLFTLSDCLIYPHEWDARYNSVILSTATPSRALALAEIQEHVDNAMYRFEELDHQLSFTADYSANDLLEAYCAGQMGASLRSLAERLSAELEGNGQWNTARAYRCACRGLLRFLQRDDISMSELNSRLLTFFERDLQARGRQPNTISYYMRNLRAIYNKAVRLALVPRSSGALFANVFTGVARTAKRSLDVDEMKKLIREREDDVSVLSRARRYFAFCFYACGMCFVDMAHLRKDDIHGEVISYCRKKTGRRIEIRLIPELRAIIHSFASETEGSPYLFPILDPASSNPLHYESALRRQNYHLKRLAALAGVNASLSTHWARHSWATLGKRANIPIPVLSECLGHSSEQVTRIYLDSFEHGVLDRANRRIAGLVSYIKQPEV